jgi:hypothetical protein
MFHFGEEVVITCPAFRGLKGIIAGVTMLGPCSHSVPDQSGYKVKLHKNGEIVAISFDHVQSPTPLPQDAQEMVALWRQLGRPRIWIHEVKPGYGISDVERWLYNPLAVFSEGEIDLVRRKLYELNRPGPYDT